jgi:hypothetical protein
MLPADHAILAEPLKQKLEQNPNCLKMWLKHTKPIIGLSKADATAAIHCSTDQLTIKLFCLKRKKKMNVQTKLGNPNHI